MRTIGMVIEAGGAIPNARRPEGDGLNGTLAAMGRATRAGISLTLLKFRRPV